MNQSYSPVLARKMAELVGEQGHFAQSGDILSWEDQTERRQYTVVYPCEFDETARLVFTLPTITRNIYVTVSDGDAALVRMVLGTIESQELETGVVLGNVLLLDDPRLAAHGIRGVMLLMPNLFNCLDNLPFHIACEGGTYPILSVVFLSGEEHRIWREQGHDALMDHWQSVGKDLIAFGGA